VDDAAPDVGAVRLRRFEPADAALIFAGRDEAFRRFIGEGSADPQPAFTILAGDVPVGWVDHDRDDDRWWLEDDEVNIGYHVFPEHRGRGHATRAVALVLDHLRDETEHQVATLLIHPDNAASLRVAERNGFVRGADVDGRTFWRRSLRPG